MPKPHVCLLLLAILLPADWAWAQIVIDDFEDVTDFSGLESDGTRFMEGSFSGLWSDTVSTIKIEKIFPVPLDFTLYDHLNVWVYSQAANGAQLQLIFDSDNDGDPAGWDYYSKELTIDWEGWRNLRIPLVDFVEARVPLGWHTINFVRVSSSGWGHTPLPDTVLNFDYMQVTNGTVRVVDERYRWDGADFVYDYDVEVDNSGTLPQTYQLAFIETDQDFTWSVEPESLDLEAGTSGLAQASIRIDAGVIASSPVLHNEFGTLLVSAGGTPLDAFVLRATSPLAERAHPALLMSEQDAERINAWAGLHAWAATERQSLLSEADAWPASYETEYGLSPWALPPEGGQWGMWYVCPVHGVELRFEGPGQHVCPVDGVHYTGWPYDQVIYGRMHWSLARNARTLGQAWLLTQDSAYALQAGLILLAYADQYLDYPIHDSNGNEGGGGARVTASTLDESGWLVEMAWAWDLVQASGVLGEPEKEHIEDHLLREAVAVIQRYDAGISNWQSWHNAAIGGVGFSLDDPRLESDAWNRDSSFLFQMGASVSADGFWYEGSWSYHFYALKALTFLAEMARRAGLDPLDGTPLIDMFTSPITFAEPNGVLPPFNDALHSNLSSREMEFETAYGWTSDPVLALPLDAASRSREALFWGAETLDSTGAEAASQSLVFPDSGYAVMRAGFSGADPVYLALDYGPHGGWHGHYDKLGFVLYGTGRELAVDPGRHPYSLPIHDEWDRETVAHNTVVVDATTQQQATGNLLGTVFLPDVSLAKADAGESYSEAGLLREMLVTDRYVIDRFDTVGLDTGTHQYDWILHTGGTLAPHGLPAHPHDFAEGDGYSYLEEVERVDAELPLRLAWDLSGPVCVEECSTWANDPAIQASFEASDREASEGSSSGQMHYDFSAATGYVVFSVKTPPSIPQDQAPDGLRIDVFGDGSANRLAFRLNDATGERFVYTYGTIDFSGWQSFELLDPEGWTHYLGNDDGVVDPPVTHVSVELLHQGGSEVSEIYADEIALLYGADLAEVSDFEGEQLGLYLPAETGSGGFELFTGTGPSPWGETIPFVMLRKNARDTSFHSLIEPSRTASAASLELRAAVTCPAEECRGYRVSHPDYTDSVLWDAGFGAGAALIEIDDGSSTDGRLGYCRRQTAGQTFVRMALAAGTALGCDGTSLVTTSAVVPTLQADLYDGGDRVEVSAEVGEDTEIRILAPTATEVQLNGAEVSYVREGDYVVFDALHTSPDNDADGTPDDEDCAPLDPGAAQLPLEVQALELTREQLAWAPEGQASTTYNISGGLLSTLSMTDYGHCLAQGLTETSWSDPEPLPAGQTFFYIVSGENCFGEGSLGPGRVNTNPERCP